MKKTTDPDLPGLVQRFFTEYLRAQRNLSAHTCGGYRDTIRLLLSFLSERHRQPVDRLSLQQINPDTILAFLGHLETARGNCPRTRNLRLAAIRTFVRFVLGQTFATDFAGTAQRILAIPQKKSPKRIVGFMTAAEIDAVLAAIDQTTHAGRRDHLLFTFLYNSGARINEALQLHPEDICDRAVLLHGKGRKERSIPLWPRTIARLLQWCKMNQINPSHPLFPGRLGKPLSQDCAASRLALAVRKAAEKCPSLRGRKITCHTLRHSCAMSLLRAGVALEVIALWLGHAQPITTHGYIEADLKMKEECLLRLAEPPPPKSKSREEPSRLLAFLRGI